MKTTWGYKWKCPKEGCYKEGRKYVTGWRARRGFRRHMIEFHNDYNVEPVMVCKKLEGGRSVWEVKKK